MILIEKSARRLTLLDANGNRLFSCSVQLGRAPFGAKMREGDGRTPEGRYRVCSVNRESKFHAALGINYPNRFDAGRARKEKRISAFDCLRITLADRLSIRPPWKTPLGGYIMLHGESPEGKTGDWTVGCVAMANADIDRLISLSSKKELVEIRS